MFLKYITVFFLVLTNVNPTMAMVKAHYDNVLGTSMDISLSGVSQKEANSAINKTLLEIKRLETLLSKWNENSQINLLNKNGKVEQASIELTHVISACEKWRTASKNSFSCRLGLITERWLEAEKTQELPKRVDIRYLARDIGRKTLKFDITTNHIELNKNIKIDPNGLAKGYIIDMASKHLLAQLPEATGLKLDIGGDAFYWGQTSTNSHWKVAVPLSQNVSDSATNDAYHVNLSTMAIASSGHNYRYININRRKFSHIINPKDGWPMYDAPSATVIAKNALTADAVATALSTQPATQGIDWVNSLPDVEALITLPNSIKIASKGWSSFIKTTNTSQSPLVSLPSSKTSSALKITYQIPTFKANDYNKPYIAIWISDAQKKHIRSLLLLGESERWAKENTRWWRHVGRKEPQLLDGIARPTRKPGEYHLLWDGLTDSAKFAESSEYFLHVEYSREKGGHDYQKIKFEFNRHLKPTKNINIKAKGEIGEIELTYPTSISTTK